MSIRDIPANEIVTMSTNLHRAFCSQGCEPACHGCSKSLPPGSQFQLATLENKTAKSVDVMLCEMCKPSSELAERIRPSGQGCFRVNGEVEIHL
jgi:hypothetical protein